MEAGFAVAIATRTRKVNTDRERETVEACSSDNIRVLRVQGWAEGERPWVDGREEFHSSAPHMDFNRLSGAQNSFSCPPGIETPGYSRSFLRNEFAGSAPERSDESVLAAHASIRRSVRGFSPDFGSANARLRKALVQFQVKSRFRGISFRFNFLWPILSRFVPSAMTPHGSQSHKS